MLHIRPIVLAVTALLCLLGTADAAAIYDPGTGRFLQRDPTGYPDGMNSYAAYHALHGGVDPVGLEAGPVPGLGEWWAKENEKKSQGIQAVKQDRWNDIRCDEQ